MQDASFEEFMRARGPVLARIAYLLTGDHAAADDLTQAALANAYARWDRVVAMDRPEAYVRRMIVNQHVSWWRSWGRREETRAVLPELAVEDQADDVTGRAVIHGVIRALPPRQRAAVVLRFFEQMTDVEIAETLGCSASTVRSQLCRALESIRAGGLLSELVGARSQR